MRDTFAVRATGLQSDALPAVIEIIEDDGDSFGDRGPTTAIPDSGGPRWVGPTAAAVLIALVGYGVATSATKGLPKVAAPPTTSVAPASTAPAQAPTTSTEPPPVVPYYAADPPRQFAVRSADFLAPDTRRLRENDYQLWAVDGASATSGSWFSIEGYDTDPDSLFTVDAYRAQAGKHPIAIVHLPTGHSVAEFVAARSVQVRLTALGWSDEDLVRLAQSISIEDDHVQLGDPSLYPGYEFVTAVPPYLVIEGRLAEQISYTSSTSPSGDFTVLVSQRPPIPGGVKSRERQIALRFLLDQATPFEVDGHSGVAGVVIGHDRVSIATWVAGDHIVTLAADMPVPDLVAIAQTVRPVTLDVWRGMQFQAATRGGGNDFDGQNDVSTPVTVSSGTDTDANPWVVSVTSSTFGTRRLVTWRWDRRSFDALAAPQPAIDTVVDFQRTYVLAQLPRDVAATAQLQINRTGLDPIVVPFNDTGAAFDRTFAAYAFSEAAPYTAQIVGADGTVLASWPQ